MPRTPVITRADAVEVVERRLNVIGSFGGEVSPAQLRAIRKLIITMDAELVAYEQGWLLIKEALKGLAVVAMLAAITLVSVC